MVAGFTWRSTAVSATAIDLLAPAKVNLYLRILGKRTDGYHELDSLMIKLKFGDKLIIKRRRHPGIGLRCLGAELPENRDNLVYRAAEVFCAHCEITPALDITLEKRIPVAAGLGGGSSDAAAVLRGLDQLYDTHLGEKVLCTLARPLGADVPFFVQGAPAAWARGIGELLTPVDGQSLLAGNNWILLVNPGFTVATAGVYHNFRLTKQRDPFTLPGDSSKMLPAAHNDLETVTMSRYPELAFIKKQLLAAGAVSALMAGSGPTVFAIFRKEDAARSEAAQLSRQYPRVILTKPWWGVVKR